eukprot:4753899-Pleurochrysis_carterae.AAC.1
MSVICNAAARAFVPGAGTKVDEGAVQTQFLSAWELNSASKLPVGIANAHQPSPVGQQQRYLGQQKK